MIFQLTNCLENILCQFFVRQLETAGFRGKVLWKLTATAVFQVVSTTMKYI